MPTKSLNEVMNALSICGRQANCCIGCPYQDVSYPTKIGNTCKDVLHYDALSWLREYRTRADSLAIKVMFLEKRGQK